MTAFHRELIISYYCLQHFVSLLNAITVTIASFQGLWIGFSYEIDSNVLPCLNCSKRGQKPGEKRLLLLIWDTFKVKYLFLKILPKYFAIQIWEGVMLSPTPLGNFTDYWFIHIDFKTNFSKKLNKLDVTNLQIPSIHFPLSLKKG